MLLPEDFFPIGRIGKPHGLKGEIRLQDDDGVLDATGADCIFIDVEGILVPFFIEDYRYRSEAVCLVKLEGIDTIERAAELTGCTAYAERAAIADDEDGDMPSNALIGLTVVDRATGRELGRIEHIDSRTENTLLCLEGGTLLPCAGADLAPDGDGRIEMTIPEGLLELG